MRFRTSLFLVALAAVGCKQESATKPSSSASATASAPSVASCGDKSKELGAWMTAANAEGMGPPAPFEQMRMKLVARGDGDPWAWHGASLLFDQKAVQLDFDRLGVPGEEASKKKLAEQLEARAKTALAAGISMGLDVYIHRDTPWETVVVLLDQAAASGFRTVGLVFEGPSKVKAPSSPLLAELVKADARRRDADPFEEAAPAGPADKAFAKCRPAISLLQDIGKRELTPKEKTATFAKRAPGAWQSCRCRIDDDALMALQWHWLGRTYGPPTRSVKVLLSPADDQDAAKVAAPKSKPWSEVADKVVQAAKSGKRVSLAIEG